MLLAAVEPGNQRFPALAVSSLLGLGIQRTVGLRWGDRKLGLAWLRRPSAMYVFIYVCKTVEFRERLHLTHKGKDE